MDIYTAALWVYAALVPLTLLVTSFVRAPYGRHGRSGWGPTLPERWGWVLMESPSVLVPVLTLALAPRGGTLVPAVLLALWQLHYLQRTLVYPFLIRARGRRMPVLVAALAFAYTGLNGWTNFHFLGHLANRDPRWLVDPRFLLGLALFLGGLATNLWADRVLRRLRKPGQTTYQVPRGGLYRWISCPNYLGEMVEWTGWALMAWSLPGLLFALYTVANLGPRAVAHHRWYQATFPDYPSARKALLPGIL